MIKTTLNSKERVGLAYQHQTTDRIPIGNLCAGINPPAFKALDKFLQENRQITASDFINSCLDLTEVWAFDIIRQNNSSATDCWGVKREAVNYGEGYYDEIVHYPLHNINTVQELKGYSWPKTKWFDYEAVPELIKQKQTRPDQVLALGVANLFETSWYMRGLENLMMDMLINPDLVHAIMNKVTDFFIEHFKHFVDAANGKIAMAFTADDLGGQEGLFISLELIEEFIKPYHQRINKAMHDLGIQVVYHSDGAIAEAVPTLIDMGIDILEALQFNAKGMNPKQLKDQYGDRLCFEGGVCVQKLLPYGTPEDVADYVRNLIDTLGKNGGYVLAPSHYIQAGTPPENIVAMFDTALSYYPH